MDGDIAFYHAWKTDRRVGGWGAKQARPGVVVQHAYECGTLGPWRNIWSARTGRGFTAFQNGNRIAKKARLD